MSILCGKDLLYIGLASGFCTDQLLLSPNFWDTCILQTFEYHTCFSSSITFLTTTHLWFSNHQMAAFSSQYYHPFLLHSISSLGDQHQQQPLINTPSPSFHNQTSLNTLTNQDSTSDIKNHSPQTSMVVDKLENGEQVTQKVTSLHKKRRPKNGPSSVNFLDHFSCFTFLQTHVSNCLIVTGLSRRSKQETKEQQWRWSRRKQGKRSEEGSEKGFRRSSNWVYPR